MRAFPWERLEVAEATAAAAPWVAALARAEGRCLVGGGCLGAADPAAQPAAVAFDLSAGAATAVAVVPGRAVVAIAEDALGRGPELPAPRPTTEVERALAAFALIDALAAGGVVAVAAERTASVAGPGLALSLAAPVPGHVVIAAARGALALPPLAWSVAARRAGRLPSVVARVELAAAPIAPSRLGGLASRDVVVVGPPAPRLRVARGSFAAALDPATGRLTVTGPYRRHAMPDPAELFAADATVSLTVAVGDVALSARALLELEPGAVVTTGVAVGAPVELRAGDRVIARGELVVVDGAIGVRLQDILSTPAEAC